MQVQDPVCGKLIYLEDAESSVDHDGWAYFFCSERCRRLFGASPARFANQPRAMNAGPEGPDSRRRSKCTNEPWPR